MARAHSNIPYRLNLLLSAGFMTLAIYQLFILPLVLLPQSLHWAWTLIPAALLTTTNWALVHECFHGTFHPNAKSNDRAGRALCIALGSPYRVLRIGHLMHHRFNRSELDRTEVAPVKRPSLGTRAIYYARLFGGLYLAEFLASIAALLPRRSVAFLVSAAFGAEAPDGRTMHKAARQQLLEAPGYQEMRWDGLAICLLYGASAWAYGTEVWVLGLIILARAFLLSFFDNCYHYATPLDDVLSAFNLRLPPVFARLILNFNLHGVHHCEPAAPWISLPSRFTARGETYEGNYLDVAWRQMSGPIAAHTLPNPAPRKTPGSTVRPTPL